MQHPSLLEEEHQEKAGRDSDQTNEAQLTVGQCHDLPEHVSPLSGKKQRHQAFDDQNHANGKEQDVLHRSTTLRPPETAG
ncbi:hypothetical protein THICB2_730136 [Thiomonas sp. CB2]|nr:hypothetical protein THICB2_730136 [Thiomonas sp. CB2]VDY06975.1 protein of unknown function [Thiomonas sp. Bio17B3]VDY09728.1 protein of unknown function [Thiomonas sp. Sup16B3]VDY15249.1 conserved protein of unknown function [Thiomonas sp. OC7]VDY15577.1 protein of unknown function [Thiomonas sp. CB2]